MVHTHPKQGGINTKSRGGDHCGSILQVGHTLPHHSEGSMTYLAPASTHWMLAGSNFLKIKDQFPILILCCTTGIIILGHVDLRVEVNQGVTDVNNIPSARVEGSLVD